MTVSEVSIKERLALFVKRTEFYLSKGYDRIRASEFIADCREDLNSPALDVGAGKGTLSIALAKKGLSVIGVDINSCDLEVARFRVEKEGIAQKVRFLTLDARSLPFKDHSFKTVAMMDVLHHLEIEDGEKVLSEMVRTLSQDGTMIIAEFDKKGFEIVADAHRSEGTVHYTSGFTLESASLFLLKNRMSIVSKLNAHCNDIVVFKKSP